MSATVSGERATTDPPPGEGRERTAAEAAAAGGDVERDSPAAASSGPAGPAEPTETGPRSTLREAAKAPYLLLAFAVLVADQWTKWLLETHLPVGAVREVVPGLLNINHVRNTGVAFGLFASHGEATSGWLLALVGLFALALVGLYFAFTHRNDRLLLFALALVLGGAVGNLIDRMASGAVTDFVDVYVGSYHWPSFNVADSAITVGIVLMAWDAWRQHESADAAEAEG